MEIFGENPQGLASHAKFRAKFQFPFPLLIDKGQKVAALYHANGIVVKRTVYRIDAEGFIAFAQRGMPAPRDVLAL